MHSHIKWVCWSICPDLFCCKSLRCMFLASLLKIRLTVATEHRRSSNVAEWRLVEQSQPNDLGSGIPRLDVSHVEEDFMMPLATFKALFTYPTEKQSNWAIFILLLLSLFYLHCQYWGAGFMRTAYEALDSSVAASEAALLLRVLARGSAVPTEIWHSFLPTPQ